MRRLIYICLFVAIVPWIVIGIVREATDDDTKDHYFVRAVFDNASSIVSGEDVKVAGVPVGVVSSMDVTDDNKAAVTLQINDEKFTPFKTDATCKIRLQGLIGERFVECEPGSAEAPQLATIKDGAGKGERLLSVDHNSAPVDIDLLNDILRLPYRQRFAILLSELGVGLAGRGDDLNEVIHRANPALKETDDVLAILAQQNHVLARLARDSDQALAPLSREREHFADFIEEANKTGEATAERATDQRRTLRLLPDTLRQLRLLMVDLGTLADQGTPLLTDVNASAPDLGRLIKAQGTLAQASNKAFPSLGDALEVGRPGPDPVPAADPGPEQARHGDRPDRQEPRLAHEEPRRDACDRAHQRLPLLRHPLDQRVRLARPLLARRRRGERVRRRAQAGRRPVQLELLRVRHQVRVGGHPRGAQRARAQAGDRTGQRAGHRDAAPGPARHQRDAAADARAQGLAAEAAHAVEPAVCGAHPGRADARLPARG